jgi:hypothetical protein
MHDARALPGEPLGGECGVSLRRRHRGCIRQDLFQTSQARLARRAFDEVPPVGVRTLPGIEIDVEKAFV